MSLSESQPENESYVCLSRKVRGFTLDPNLALCLLRIRQPTQEEVSGIEYLCLSGKELPEDARIINITYEVYRHAFVITVHSEEFDKVPIGQEMPIDPVPMMFRVVKVSPLVRLNKELSNVTETSVETEDNPGPSGGS